MEWFDWVTNPQAWLTLVTLTVLEVVLGIDNIIFLTILVAKVPKAQQKITRQFGLALAMLTRIGLLLSISWVMRLTKPLFSIADLPITGRDLILIVGGLFLVYKSAVEIYADISEIDESEAQQQAEDNNAPSLVQGVSKGVLTIVLQIAVIDIVFSLDSVITAVGLSPFVPVMVLAIMIAVGMMMFAAKPIGDFVERHPTIKMLALAFLVLVGGVLIADGLGFHVPKGYLYTAMAFSFAVELLNIRRRGKHARHLRVLKTRA